ncbi:glycosyltransferase family 61 protein [Saccharibacillus sacchari]|uniref:glycosyltransferase family 61 protein n=1 Tax=Saccharibacillus sacchari TaxID=456493 RepID=UPI0004B1EC5F|nr:glycosyltransferase family 61 protein [Saccharibacillus sacchari]
MRPLEDFLIEKSLVLFGTGTTAGKLNEQISVAGIRIDYFSDNDLTKWGENFQQHLIVAPSELRTERDVIVIASEYEAEIAEQLTRMGFVMHHNCLLHTRLLIRNNKIEYCWDTKVLSELKAIVPLDDLKATSLEKIPVLQSDYRFLCQNPINVSGSQYPSFMIPQQSYPLKDVNIYIFEQGTTTGDNGVILTAEGYLIREFSTFTTLALNIWDAQRVKIDVIGNKDVAVLKHTVAVTTTQWSGANYYHWMMEELPRFYLLGAYKEPIDYYISNYTMRAFQQETLECMGIPIHSIIKSSNIYAIQAEKLVVPYSPAYDSGYVSKWICNFLNRLFSSALQIDERKYHKHIYIARGNAKNRKVVNEEDVIEYLTNMGFQIVYLERHSVREQAAIFYNAEVIIGPHGAGLTNLVFCRKQTKVLELFSPMYAPIMFWNICENQDLIYHCAVGDRTDFEYTERVGVYVNEKDIHVNIEDISRFVSLYL